MYNIENEKANNKPRFLHFSSRLWNLQKYIWNNSKSMRLSALRVANIRRYKFLYGKIFK